MTNEIFTELYSSYRGEEADNIDQFQTTEFSPKELKEFVEYCLLYSDAKRIAHTMDTEIIVHTKPNIVCTDELYKVLFDNKPNRHIIYVSPDVNDRFNQLIKEEIENLHLIQEGIFPEMIDKTYLPEKKDHKRKSSREI